MASFQWPSFGSGNAFTSIELDGATSGHVIITVPSVVASYTITLPGSQGAAGSTLVNDGSGGLTWQTAANITIGTINSQTAVSDGLQIIGDVLYAQYATGAVPGMVSTLSQTFLGQKTFSTGLTGTLTGAASLNVLTSALGNLTDVGTDGITVGNGTGAVVGNVTLSQHVADSTHNGYLSSTDWSTFNGKQASGNYITALTGDGTASGPGSSALTLATVNGNVGSFTYASITVNGKGLITAAANGAAPLSNPMTTLGDIIYESASPAPARLAGNTTAVKQYLSQTGTGAISAIPAWATIAAGDIGSGTLATARGGTNLDTSASTGIAKVASGTWSVAAAAASDFGTQTKNTFLAGPTSGSNATPTFRTVVPADFTAPTSQRITSQGTQTGWLFTISTSTTCAVGDTYTNNSTTYTVQGALSAQSGSVLWMLGVGSPNTGAALVRTSGAGTSSITFSANTATATYTPTAPPLYIIFEGVGGSGGGAGSASAGGSDGGDGSNTALGPNIFSANAGTRGLQSEVGGTGGVASVTTGTGIARLAEVAGAGGSPGGGNIVKSAGGPGGCSFFGGGGTGGPGGTAATAGVDATTNSGSGGGGGGGSATSTGVSGGGAGGYCKVLLTGVGVLASYPYILGSAGSAGTGGTAGAGGGAGSKGLLVAYEYYQ